MAEVPHPPPPAIPGAGPTATLGQWGEQVAVDHLQAAGVVVLERNWRCREGELDVVAIDGECLVVVEVKTRSGTGYGSPAEAVTPLKLARMRRLAHRWLSERRMGWVEVRFDVVAVVADRRCGAVTVEHLPGVF